MGMALDLQFECHWVEALVVSELLLLVWSFADQIKTLLNWLGLRMGL
jgi:hypothetical protein